MASTRGDFTIFDGLSQPVLEFFKKTENFTSYLYIGYGPRLTNYSHEGLYLSPKDNEFILNPKNKNGLLRIWEAKDSGKPIYRRIIDFPIEWKPWLQKGVKKRLGGGCEEEMVKLEDHLYPSYSDGIVRVILQEDRGILRFTNSENLAEYKEFANKYLQVSDAANSLFPYIKNCFPR